MAMPNDLILIRHGKSEANIVQRSVVQGDKEKVPKGFHDRHDSHMRLSYEGADQAKLTGEWLRKNNLAEFDRYYVSPHIRARETAARLGIHGDWRVDDRWRERDWGEYAGLSNAERSEKYAISKKLREQHEWYWCPPGGESLATEVRLRFEDILETLHRETSTKRVVAVTHGEMMQVARFVLERMTPEQWSLEIADNNHVMKNCLMLHYSRINPVTGEQSERLSWRRAICSWDKTLSWNKGEWVELKPKTFTDEELLESVKDHQHLLDKISD